MSLLHTTVWLRLSHICSNLSCPAVANWGKVGWAASPQTSSACPSIAGLKPISTSPTRMQFLVVPTNSWEPLPSESVRIPPKWSSICGEYVLLFYFSSLPFIRKCTAIKLEKHVEIFYLKSKIELLRLACASSPVMFRDESKCKILPSFPPPVIILPFFKTHIEKIDPSWRFLTSLEIVLVPTLKYRIINIAKAKNRIRIFTEIKKIDHHKCRWNILPWNVTLDF